jgi:cysteine desulfurase/selenocysteine lyase
VIFTQMEHHSNIVPWQMLRDRTGITLKAVPITPEGELDMAAFEELLTPRTKLVAVVHISNALGTINPVKEIAQKAHALGAKVLVDGCQALPHMKVDVRDLDVDFYAFSGHKMYGPTGIGALYGKKALLDALPPYQGGGEMIASVTLEKSTFKAAPHRFEAGTPAIVEAVGIGAAVDYLNAIGMEKVAAHEEGLLAYATQQLQAIEGLTLHGTAREKAGILSFTLDSAHAHDIGTIVDRTGVAVRAGHHCAQPVMDAFGVAATARASIGLYNTKTEIDALVESIKTVKEFFG